MKKVFLLILFLIVQNSSWNAQASSFDMLPYELTHKILADYPLSFQLQCRLINQNFSQKLERIMNHAWDWSEQIPRMFYEYFSEYNKNLEDPFQPKFIKELCKTKLEIALPFFVFIISLTKNIFKQRSSSILKFKKILSIKIVMKS